MLEEAAADKRRAVLGTHLPLQDMLGLGRFANERDDFARMGTGRVGTLRVALPWAQIDPTPDPGDLNWSEFDATVIQAARQRIEVLPTVYTVPQWVSLIEGCNGAPDGHARCRS